MKTLEPSLYIWNYKLSWEKVGIDGSQLQNGFLDHPQWTLQERERVLEQSSDLGSLD